MIKKRGEKRIAFRKLVLCKCGGEMHPAFTQDVSQHGIGIQTTQYTPLHHKVRIALAVEQDSIFIDGEVRWMREYSDQQEVKPCEVGIFIRKPQAEYLRLVAECCDRSRPRSFFQPLK